MHMIKKIAFSEAVGRELAHDITEIRPGEFKGAAFRKGHVIQDCDCSHFQRLGKEHFFDISIEEDEFHENEAAEWMARALCGEGISWFEPPHEGKIALRAKHNGLLKIHVDALARFNIIPEVMCATRHNNDLVEKGDVVAGTRAIPLVVKKGVVHEACRIAEEEGGILSLKSLRASRAGLVITGNEVYNGLIEDRFEPILRKKVASLGGEVVSVSFAPDNPLEISRRLKEALSSGADLILISGGMSVDPDDVTRDAVRAAGAERLIYGSAVLPGAMFMLAYLGDVPVLGMPACGLFHRITVLDLILPRVLAGEILSEKDIALLGHGGLCLNCSDCIYPRCGFGKGQ
jgi:molybdenum cofactor synthesis domain-containing protein